MDKVEINSYEDLFNVLDRINESIDWNTFYEKRVMKAPFLVNNMLPDKMITEFVKGHSIRDAVEFGCGEGRNAIFLAKRGIDVTAIDSSDIAIRNAKDKTEDLKNVRLICSDFLAVDFADRKYDLVLDSGMFHHLAPHRRLQYRELLKGLLKETGYFVLLCFSADEDGAEELDDLEFYTKRNTGVAFSEQRLRDFFGSDFEIISIEKRGQEITEEYIDIPLLYGCVMKLNPRHYLCKRFFPELPVERNWFGELIREVISVDGALFPKEEQTLLTKEQAMTIEIEDGYQVLRVLCVPGEKDSTDIPDIATQTVEGFEFCGFDLADSWVSAILNCGSFTDGDYYSKAFDYRELNEFGLISDYQSAIRISRKLREEYPEEEHVYCDVYAIWRRI